MKTYWAATDKNTGKLMFNPWSDVPVLHAKFIPVDKRFNDENHITLTEVAILPADTLAKVREALELCEDGLEHVGLIEPDFDFVDMVKGKLDAALAALALLEPESTP